MGKVDINLVIKLWDYLVNIAKKWEKKTYSDVSKDLKIWNPQLVWKILGDIQQYCLDNKRPALTSLIINSSTWLPWDWFFKKDLPFEQIWKEVYEYKWENNPFDKEKFNDNKNIDKWKIKESNKVEDILLEWFPEWEKVERIHKKYERNHKLVEKAKENYKSKNNWELPCEICNFNFKSEYWNKEFIEAHHKIPLSSINDNRETKIEDLAMLCANCHRMIHFYSKKGCIDFDNFKKIYKLNKKNK